MIFWSSNAREPKIKSVLPIGNTSILVTEKKFLQFPVLESYRGYQNSDRHTDRKKRCWRWTFFTFQTLLNSMKKKNEKNREFNTSAALPSFRACPNNTTYCQSWAVSQIQVFEIRISNTFSNLYFVMCYVLKNIFYCFKAVIILL